MMCIEAEYENEFHLGFPMHHLIQCELLGTSLFSQRIFQTQILFILFKTDLIPHTTWRFLVAMSRRLRSRGSRETTTTIRSQNLPSTTVETFPAATEPTTRAARSNRGPAITTEWQSIRGRDIHSTSPPPTSSEGATWVRSQDRAATRDRCHRIEVQPESVEVYPALSSSSSLGRCVRLLYSLFITNVCVCLALQFLIGHSCSICCCCWL